MVTNILNRVINHVPKNFVAPALTKNVNLFVVQDGIPYRFKATVESPGWYYFSPDKESKRAKVLREAHPSEYYDYKDSLQTIHVITLFPINDMTWLVIPYNISDAQQRGWVSGAPRTMYLADNISSMDVVGACMASNTLIFNYLTTSSKNDNTKEVAIALNIINKRLEAIQAHEINEQRKNKSQTALEKIESSLAFMGATLEDWTKEIDGYNVRWKIDGQTYRMQIDTNTRIQSAGVCLEGTDDWHSLSSVVDVMTDRRQAIESGDHGDW